MLFLLCVGSTCRYGRKIVLCGSGILQFVFAIAQPYFTNFVLYSGSLFFYGMFGSGLFIVKETDHVC